MKKLPYGISNYEQLIKDDYYYVDKTEYIEMIENLAERNIMCLRPRKFGKTLFTSTLEYYYDVNAKSKFKELFKNTYIGKHPTKLRNRYHILKFNFSGIDTSNDESTIVGFKTIVQNSIQAFVLKYGINFYVNPEQTAEGMLDSLFVAFVTQKANQKIYVIIDEYDHFANELLSFNTSKFKELVSRNGKVRKWYEILKKGTESVVDRIFITGVAPITLDSLTSGFNICSDRTRDVRFNQMLGFTKEELINLLNELKINKQNQETILPILKENYDGYKFAKDADERIYNSNMCLYLLNNYLVFNRIPDNLLDTNIASDYKKLGEMLKLCTGEKRKEILEKTLSGEGIITNITEKFNPEMEFKDTEFASMLYYLGYLTIAESELGKPKLKIPNKTMREIYADYFIEVMDKETNLFIYEEDYNQMLREMALEGKIDKIVETVQKYLNNLSNRDYQRFDEKYVKIIFYCICMNLNLFNVKSEPEVNRKYPDILLVPKDYTQEYHAIMVEFKYLKAGEKEKIQEVQTEARKQIEEYGEFEEIKTIPNLHKYTIVAVNDKLFVEEV